MTTPLDPEALRLCRASLSTNSRSFSWASLLLPRHARGPVAVFYAWCRRCDDAVDDATPEGQPAALARLQAEVEDIYAGKTMQEAVLAAFQVVVQHYGIPRIYVDELLNGFAMDVGNVRYCTHDQLLLYCYRVAGVVGLMMCHIMGIADEKKLDRAAHLGIAMQLTNICRDVVEDWGLGRRYVPAELLSAPSEPGGVFPKALVPEYVDPVRSLLAEADRYYASADQGIRVLGLRSALAVRMARKVYSAIGSVIAARGYDVGAGRAVVSGWRKLAIMLHTIVVTAAELPFRARQRGRLSAPHHIVRFEDATLAA